ncbi:MAG: hypothetical protein AB7E51_13160 [Pseudodesulfovibrio sp.]|jgi:hypothetical protein|uniref:hypothetical protein n=1 Tax=Pseudodesulfovibrio sp. TaxID=2035812 RepID=UPI003D117C85
MIDPVSAYSPASSVEPQFKAVPKAERLPSSSGPAVVVGISEETMTRFKADMAVGEMVRQAERDKADSAAPSPWKLPSGLTHAERTLKNGHTEIIDIDGGTLTVREYDGDRLVKSVDGTMADGRAVLDTTYYDESGKASQTIHAELATLETRNGWSGAVMTRSVQWFEDGRTVRTMGDEMYLRTRNDGPATVGGNEWGRMTGEMKNDSDSLVRMLTSEEHSLGYHADIQEYYDNGQLSRSMIIGQTGEYAQVSNRHGFEVEGMGEMSTNELSHDTGLEVRIWEYDRDGEMIREATVIDNQKDGTGSEDGKQTQTADVSWYKDGEKVKHGKGSLVLEEVATAGLMKRPGILDLLGLKPDEYLSPEPQEADELLGRKALDSSAQADFFLEGAGRAAAKGWYGSAADMGEYGHRGQPFAVDWTTELYEEGEVVMRKRDSQRAVSAPYRGVDERLPFRIVGGLSDGDRPVVLESAEHETTLLENGKTVAREAMSSREIIQPSEEGPDTLMTLAHYERLNDDGDDGVNVIFKGGLELADPDARAALRSMGDEVDLTMTEVHHMYRDLRGDTASAGPDSILRYEPLDG